MKKNLVVALASLAVSRTLALGPLLLIAVGCSVQEWGNPAERAAAPEFTITADQKHNRFSNAIEPALRVPSGALVEAFTTEASDGQLNPGSQVADVENLDFDPIHPLTGPIYVEWAEPGDVLAVHLESIETGDWGWAAIVPHFGFLADSFPDAYLRTFAIPAGATSVPFLDGVAIPLNPFAGVMGVAPPTDSMLSTIPPRANGGNMDNRHLTAGTTVYFPVFVEGALFSIGDTHAAQGDGEVSGTGLEAPMRIVMRLSVIKGRTIPEPQYETDDYYAVTAYAADLDAAAVKATLYMIDYLVQEKDMARDDAYVLISLAGDLKISEVVDVPHVLVSLHLPKTVFNDD